MSTTPVTASPLHASSPSSGAPIYPRHVELTSEEIAAKERRESSGIIANIRPPSFPFDSPASLSATPIESSYLWYALTRLLLPSYISCQAQFFNFSDFSRFTPFARFMLALLPAELTHITYDYTC